MANRATPPRGSMSLIPYNRGSTDIVLRHGAAIVLYDTQTRQISLGHDSSHTASDGTLSRTDECPACHRPLTTLEGEQDRRPSSGDRHEATFTDPEYFRLLNRSLPSSHALERSPTRPAKSTFLKSLTERSQERVSRSVSGASLSDVEESPRVPQRLVDAEFVGSAPAPEITAHGISSQAFSQGYFQRFFITEKELGRGGKGVVFLVMHVLDDVSLGRFACKRVPVGNDHEWLKKTLVEVQLLTNLIHPNLVQYKHVWLEDYKISTFGPSVPCAFILQQYCNAGDLHSFILDSARVKVTNDQMKDRLRRRSKGQIDTPDILHGPRRMHFDEIFSFFKDITAGLHHLHANNYIHRDLKPSNCLLHRSASGQIKVLVSDFGEVQVVSARRSSTGSTGTISYCAPEVLLKDATTGGLGNFTTKSDIFSLGMIVYFMCFGRLPYQSANQLEEENEDVEQLREEIAHWVGFDDQEKERTDLPDRLYKFLKRLLSVVPDERPSTDEILQMIGVGGDPEEFGSSQARPHVFHDIESRVQSIETPSPTPQRMPSERRGSHAPELSMPDAGTARSFRYSRQGPTRLRHVSPAKAPGRQDSSAEPVRAAYVEGEESDADALPDTHMENSLTLRSRKPSHASPSRVAANVSPSRSPQRLLLPPPPTAASYISSILAGRRHRAVLKFLLFAAKVVTLLQPCAPYAPRGWVMYPLLALAALDFAHVETHGSEQAHDTRFSVALLAIHLAIVTGVGKWHGLCTVPAAIPVMQWG